MPVRKQLLKLTQITDDDTGIYHIGEIDGIFPKWALEDYLEAHGEKGMAELTRSLTFLQWQIQDAWNDVQTKEDTIAMNAINMKEFYAKDG